MSFFQNKPFPTEEDLIDRLDINMQWDEYKQQTLNSFLKECRSAKRWPRHHWGNQRNTNSMQTLHSSSRSASISLISGGLEISQRDRYKQQHAAPALRFFRECSCANRWHRYLAKRKYRQYADATFTNSSKNVALLKCDLDTSSRNIKKNPLFNSQLPQGMFLLWKKKWLDLKIWQHHRCKQHTDFSQFPQEMPFC